MSNLNEQYKRLLELGMPEVGGLEEWRQIKEHPLYDVSSLGNVTSRDPRWRKPRRLTLFENYNGYLVVRLNVRGKSVTARAHRLVAQAFIENPEGKAEVNHLDGVKTNNNVDNLEWATRSENMLHGYKHGLIGRHNRLKGERHHKAKLARSQVLEIRANDTLSHGEMARYYNVSRQTIQGIIKRRTWRHV